MTMLQSKARLEATRTEPTAWEFPVEAVNELKRILAGDEGQEENEDQEEGEGAKEQGDKEEKKSEDMLLRIELGRAESGYYDLYLIFRNAETGVECGEVNTSCPDPPFPLCP